MSEPMGERELGFLLEAARKDYRKGAAAPGSTLEEFVARRVYALAASRAVPPPAQEAAGAVTREELEELINRELRSYELYGGNILDAIATYHNDETVKEALEIVGDWSAWLADAILTRLGETK